MQVKKPDRVPFMCPLSVGHVLTNVRKLGIMPVDYYFSPEACAEALITLMKAYGFDGVHATPWHGGFNDPDWQKKVLEIKNEEAGQRVLWKDRHQTFYAYDGSIANNPPSKLPSLGEIRVKEVEEQVERSIQTFAESKFKMLANILARVGGNYSVHGGAACPFDFLIHQMSIQDMMIALYDDPGKMKELIELGVRNAIAYALPQIKMGVDAIDFSSPSSGAGFISKEFYADFVQPFQKKVLTALRKAAEQEKKTVAFYLHTCGSIDDRLELIAETGFDGLECLDPPPLGNVDLADAKRRIGERLFIKGNIDSVNTLLKKTPQEIIDDARERIRIGGKNGGYILSTACSVAPNVPPENIKILAEAVEKYGKS